MPCRRWSLDLPDMRVKPPGSITLVEVLRSVPFVVEEEEVQPCQ